ncbi:MAG: type II secretion system protein GspD, partial [Phycisphaerales bacterium]|nr:type II secretion system protein GspD [Phycisphaerales bacterium]
MKIAFFALLSTLMVLLLGACTSTPTDQSIQDEASSTALVGGETPQLIAKPLQSTNSSRADQDGAVMPPKGSMILPGTGNFIDTKKAAAKPASVTRTAAGEVTLNFEEADIRDLIKIVFDTLKENYTIDPQVQGQVTVQTGQPLTREQLLPTLETLLRANNAVLVRDAGVYRIIPGTGAVQKGSLPPRLGQRGAGYGVRIVPLRYVSATEMQTIITPFLPEGGVLRADPVRNLLILAGTPEELANAQNTIDTFDVNWLKGMSIGMFRLQNVDSQAVATELNQFLGEGSGTPLAGMLKFVPLSKLNALLVITPQLEYLREAAIWIQRLDGMGGERLYVYHVQNSRADYMAELLNGLFNLSGGSGGSGRGGELAPGLKSTQLSSGSGLSSSSSSLGGSNSGTSTSLSSSS